MYGFVFVCVLPGNVHYTYLKEFSYVLAQIRIFCIPCGNFGKLENSVITDTVAINTFKQKLHYPRSYVLPFYFFFFRK